MNFKEYYRNSDKLINEGGLAGHMSHPYDVLSIGDFLNFYEDLLNGNIQTSEKVDGVQLTVGLNEKGKLIFARNKTEKPSTDISKKFPISHPGGDAFRAGFKALANGLEKMSLGDHIKYNLRNEDGSTKWFLNLEIMYGEIPNLIQYSDTDNFITFHGWFGGPEEMYASKDGDTSLLSDMANKIGTQKVKSEVVTFYGDVGKVKREIKKDNSIWKFTGQIAIDKERIKHDLKAVADKWKKFPEVKKLVNNKDSLSSDETFTLMKSLTAKIGAEILVNLASDLFSGNRKTPSNFPKIEGLVTQFKGNTIKITGDFAALNQKLWEPLKNGLDKDLKKLNMVVLNDVLQIPKIASIPKKTWEKYNKDAETFLVNRNKKFYSDEKKLTERVGMAKLNTTIKKTLKNLQKQYETVLKDTDNVKQDDIVKAIRLGSFKVQELQSKLKSANNRKEIVSVFAQTMFGL